MTEIQKATGGANIPDITHHFDDVISAALMVPMGDINDPNCIMGAPIIIWGKSGIGKSDRIKQASKRMELGVPQVIFPGQKQPEEFSDLPVVIKDELRTACFLNQINVLNHAGKGVLFVDEASCATPATQASMLGMVLDRTVGATAIAPAVRILLAANPPKYAAGGWGFEPPFANRMLHFFVHCPGVEEWGNWLMTEASVKISPLEGPTQMLKENWNGAWSKTKGQLYGFIRSKGTLLHQQPEPNDPQSGFCWCSPRTWWMGGRCIATVRALNMNSDLEQLFIEGCVGEGAAAEWCEWMAKADLPDPKDALMNGWKIDKQRLDRTVAVFSGMTSYVVGTTEKKDRYKMATLEWNRLNELVKAGLSDIALTHSQTLVNEGLGWKVPDAPKELKKAAEPVIYEMGKSGLVKYAAG
jgi:hypothetical protein